MEDQLVDRKKEDQFEIWDDDKVIYSSIHQFESIDLPSKVKKIIIKKAQLKTIFCTTSYQLSMYSELDLGIYQTNRIILLQKCENKDIWKIQTEEDQSMYFLLDYIEHPRNFMNTRTRRFYNIWYLQNKIICKI